jgi:hypothetical protein
MIVPSGRPFRTPPKARKSPVAGAECGHDVVDAGVRQELARPAAGTSSRAAHMFDAVRGPVRPVRVKLPAMYPQLNYPADHPARPGRRLAPAEVPRRSPPPLTPPADGGSGPVRRALCRRRPAPVAGLHRPAPLWRPQCGRRVRCQRVCAEGSPRARGGRRRVDLPTVTAAELRTWWACSNRRVAASALRMAAVTGSSRPRMRHEGVPGPRTSSAARTAPVQPGSASAVRPGRGGSPAIPPRGSLLVRR